MNMIVNDLLDLTLREVLEEYVAVVSLECGQYYGICLADDAEHMWDNYNITEDDLASFSFEPLINDELLLDGDKPVLSLNKLETICKNIGINKK